MFTTILCSTGNPDHAQYAAPSPRKSAKVCSIEEAVSVCREYIDEWNLGGGNWCGDAGKVLSSGSLVAQIAYNGRVSYV